MTPDKSSSTSLDRAWLKSPAEVRFPANWLVRTDKPDGLVAHTEGLVRFEKTNLIIRVRGRQCDFLPHLAPLSILFVIGGQEAYELDNRRIVLDERSYLIHNCGQIIGSAAHSSTCVESYTIAFWPGFAGEVLRGLVTPADQLLDNPRSVYRQPVRFFDQIYPHDDILSPQLARLRSVLANAHPTRGWLEEQHHELITRMLWVHRQIGREMEQLPAMRAATRTELYHRLHRARDFMEAGLDKPLTIPQIAGEAWFSPHHFLRQFKQAFGETPHQYLTRRRLERAQMLLRTTEMRITDICSQVGFESLGSFSWLFRQRLGQSPEQYRLDQRRQLTSMANYAGAPVADVEDVSAA
jgi:AraC family transcriptional regulator